MANYMFAMATTIQVSEELVETLRSKKMYDKESYEEIIWDLLEDSEELSEEAKRNIQQAELEFKQGKVYTHQQVKNELGL